MENLNSEDSKVFIDNLENNANELPFNFSEGIFSDFQDYKLPPKIILPKDPYLKE